MRIPLGAGETGETRRSPYQERCNFSSHKETQQS